MENLKPKQELKMSRNINKKLPSWVDEKLPEFIHSIDEPKNSSLLNDISEAIRELKFGVGSLVVPSESYVCSAFQDGLDLSTDNYKLLESLFKTYSNGNVTFLSPFNRDIGVFTGEFNPDLMDWLSSELLLSPIVLASENLNIILCIDEQNSVSFLGVNKHRILDNQYVSKMSCLENNFLESSQNYFLEEEYSEQCELFDFINKVCGWNLK